MTGKGAALNAASSHANSSRSAACPVGPLRWPGQLASAAAITCPQGPSLAYLGSCCQPGLWISKTLAHARHSPQGPMRKPEAGSMETGRPWQYCHQGMPFGATVLMKPPIGCTAMTVCAGAYGSAPGAMCPITIGCGVPTAPWPPWAPYIAAAPAAPPTMAPAATPAAATGPMGLAWLIICCCAGGSIPTTHGGGPLKPVVLT
mmetsp:Transcript_71217/g.184907  ORF Transcript_71217/g.184907 Transcript_71217/m.184907 type:complete len:203 (-) Transcript_71217:583-1191(-)